MGIPWFNSSMNRLNSLIILLEEIIDIYYLIYSNSPYIQNKVAI